MRAPLLLSLGVAVGFAGLASAQTEFPFFDDFESGEVAPNWEQDSTNNPSWDEAGEWTAVQEDLDWRGEMVEPPPGGGEWFGRLANAPASAITARRLVGTNDAVDYTISTDMYVQNVSADEPPDNFFYQMIIFGAQDGLDYCRFHFHHNEDEGTLPDGPRIRIQTRYASFDTILDEPTADLIGDDAEGWYNVRIDVNNSDMTINVTVNGVGLNDGDPITVNQAPFANGGKAGIGTYINGDTGGLFRSIYYDNFFAGEFTDVGDWAVYE